MSGLSNDLSTILAQACKEIERTVPNFESDFSPQGREFMRMSMSLLNKAGAVKEIKLTVDYNELRKKVMQAEVKAQGDDTMELVRRFDSTIDAFTQRLFAMVCIVCVYV
jgi:hypothetical protein